MVKRIFKYRRDCTELKNYVKLSIEKIGFLIDVCFTVLKHKTIRITKNLRYVILQTNLGYVPASIAALHYIGLYLIHSTKVIL